MKYPAIAAAAVLAASSASAIDIGNTGISLGGEIVAEYNITDEQQAIEFTPSLGYTIMAVNLTADTTIDLKNMDDYKLGIDWDAEVSMGSGWAVYGEVQTNDDWESDDWTIGTKWKF